MSWEMEIAMGAIIVLLLVIAGRLSSLAEGLSGVVNALFRLERKFDNLDALKVLNAQNQNLIEIANGLNRMNYGYKPPTVHFCDRCRNEFPESNRWWTVYQLGLPFKLCAYPQQKERPEDKWLHGEECIVAELRGYMTNVQRRTSDKQKRECTEYDLELGTSHTRSLNVSHCGHCEKEYSESQFWWTVSARGMEIEVRGGFAYSSYHARDYYFCGQECVLAAVEVFIAAQTGQMLEEWNQYLEAAWRRNLRAAHSAAQASPPAQAIPIAATAQEIKSEKETAHRFIPRALGRGVGQILRGLFRR